MKYIKLFENYNNWRFNNGKYYFLRWTDSPEDDIKRNFSGHMQTWAETEEEALRRRKEEEDEGRTFLYPPKKDITTGDWNYDPEWGISGYVFNDEESYNSAMENIMDIEYYHKDSKNQDLVLFSANEMGPEGYDGEETFRDIQYIKYIDTDTKFSDIFGILK